ncbi:uncharacterized protein V1518DRAFT_369051 [Limtongia smithiae]|uniref:uncharacterized protein n=1 Tax=Limtongia smithiae TaxID=1125753 RepID=UPI0034D01475
MSQLVQDSFISDDEEEVCPLCVEEFDISDKGFKPCPCGYQVCQFCYNNIRQNPELNGRCPGCRRPYDDESVEYKVVTAEEWRQDHQKQTRRDKEKRQKERERKEIEQASRKHLSGMRVIQKNLVYVIGLNPHIPHEELHNTLRGDQFFGQYGKIQKIVVNRRNGGVGNGGIGVYVTYFKKEDAAKCIAAVDGSMNDGKILRAAYGTTKYCSSYLRNQPCPNPNCMFLHEPGEEADSYTRQDLSTIQHTARQAESKPGLSRTSTTTTRSLNSTTRAVEENLVETPEQSALPPTASWAAKSSPPVQNVKLAQPATSIRTASSTSSIISQSNADSRNQLESHQHDNHSVAPRRTSIEDTWSNSEQLPSKALKSSIVNPTLSLFENALKILSTSSSIKFSFSTQILSKEEMIGAQAMPPLFAFSSIKTQDAVTVETSKSSENSSRQTPAYSIMESGSLPGRLLEPQLMHNTPFMGFNRGATPPPGLFTPASADTQDIISLVSGSRSKGTK